MEGAEPPSALEGEVTCSAWVRWPENKDLVVMGRAGTRASPPLLEFFSFDAKTASLSPYPMARFAIRDEAGNLRGLSVHPCGDAIVCSIANGCKLFELNSQDFNLRLQAKDLTVLQSVGPQKFLAFSPDGSKFAICSEDGHLRIFNWPSLHILLDEPRAHKAFRDMDISLDSEFLVTTSIDGSARIWKISDGVLLTTLTRDAGEKFECCRFSRDGTKPFLFCTVQKDGRVVTTVWDISTWKNIGYKRLPSKPTSVLSISSDGKYLALGSNDGDMYVVEVKKMEICHRSKNLHLGTCMSSIEFCPTKRVALSTSRQWGAMVTKLNVPAEWKEWQIYLLLLGLFLASAVVFIINLDSFWNFPLGRNQPARPSREAFIGDS